MRAPGKKKSRTFTEALRPLFFIKLNLLRLKYTFGLRVSRCSTRESFCHTLGIVEAATLKIIGEATCVCLVLILPANLKFGDILVYRFVLRLGKP